MLVVDSQACESRTPVSRSISVNEPDTAPETPNGSPSSSGMAPSAS